MGRNSAHRPLENKQIDSTVVKIPPPTTAPPPPPPPSFRRQPMIPKDPKSRSVRFAEIAGGKTAECAAIFCCCPCGLANLFILAAVRLPAGLCCRAIRKRILTRRAKKKVKLLESGSGSDGVSGGGSSKGGSAIDDEFAELTDMQMQGSIVMFIGDGLPARSPTAEVVELEKEVWSKYCSSGFWRSLSQKGDP